MELPAIQEQEIRPAIQANGQVKDMGPPEHLVTSREREYLAKVCWLLHDVGALALRTTFDSIHPPLTLPDHLQNVHVKSMLQKLHQQEILSDKQWRQLYPPRKKRKKNVVSSVNFDTKVLVVMLQTVCHLTPPYPHGWHAEPLPADSSLSSDVVRLQLKLQQVGALSGLRKEEYPLVWQQSVAVLQRLGNQEVRVKIQRMEGETLGPELAVKYINLVKGAWAPAESQEMVAKLRQIEMQRRRGSGAKSGYKRKDGDDNGIPPEDKVVITKCYKLLQDNVQAEDVLDRLQQGQVIKVTDRQEVLAASKNFDRMQILLPKIMKSPISYAFKLLCDAIKFKYPRIYEQVMRTRKQVYSQGISDTIDYVGLSREGLETHYKEVFSEVCVLPWTETEASIKDIYCQLDIVDSEGNKVALPELIPAQTTTSRGPRVVLEGFAGSGKTTLAATLAYVWATQPQYFQNQYKFLLYLDAQAVKRGLKEEIYNQLLPPNFKVTENEFWSLLENNAREVVIVMDGFEGGQGGPELNDIIQGSYLRGCAVLMLVRPEARLDSFVRPDYKMYNLGLKSENVSKFMDSFTRLLEEASEDDEEKPEFVLPNDIPLTTSMTNPYVSTLILAIARVHGLEKLKDITTLTSLFEQYLVTMATLYCREREIQVEGEEFPEQITRTVGQLETFAFHALTTKSLAYTEEELASMTVNPIFTELGVLIRSGPGLRWKFACSLLRDFLAGRYLADLPMDTLIQKLEKHHFLRSPRTANVIAFACGLYRNDYTTQTLNVLFKEMANHNARRCKKISFKVPDGESDIAHTNSGSVQSYSHSLMALTECQGREDMIAILAPAFPRLIQLCGEGIINDRVIKGLNYMLADSRVSVGNVEISLVPLHTKQNEIYISFAEALIQNSQLKTLTLAWSNIELMAEFLKTCLANHPSLTTLRVEECTKKGMKTVDAATWANIQTFCSSLTNVRLFSFINCKMSSVSCQVIHSIPPTLEIFDLTRSSLNMICADELGKVMENSKGTKTLILSDTTLATSDLAALFQGLKRCDTLQHLGLSGVRLDRGGLSHLIEYLKLTSTLRALDLSQGRLTLEMCTALADAIRQCRSLTRVVLIGTLLSDEGREVLESIGEDKVYMEGLDGDTVSVRTI